MTIYRLKTFDINLKKRYNDYYFIVLTLEWGLTICTLERAVDGLVHTMKETIPEGWQ